MPVIYFRCSKKMRAEIEAVVLNAKLQHEAAVRSARVPPHSLKMQAVELAKKEGLDAANALLRAHKPSTHKPSTSSIVRDWVRERLKEEIDTLKASE